MTQIVSTISVEMSPVVASSTIQTTRIESSVVVAFNQIVSDSTIQATSIESNVSLALTEIAATSEICIGMRGLPGRLIDGIVHELLTGTQDDVNLVFMTTLPIRIGTEWIRVNGIPQRSGMHYTVSGLREITLNYAPRDWWTLEIEYEELV